MAIPKIELDTPGIEYLDEAEAANLLDRQARKYFGMSGVEFARQYRDGTLPDPDQSKIAIIAMLIPESERDVRSHS